VDTQEVLHTLAPKEIEVQTEAGAWHMLRIHPYRTQENVIEGAVIAFVDISEMKRIQEELRESNEEMQNLAERLNVAREEERAAVAWELHDEVSQALAVVRATLFDWGGRLPADVPENARHGLDETVTLLDATIARLRTLYADIVPVMLEDLSLAAAIQWQVEEFGRRAELQCMIGTLDIVALPDARTSLSLFRVLQEALQTTARRPGVTRVTVAFVREGDDAVLHVTDDGRGVINEDLLKPGTPALISIRSRAHSWGGQVRFRRNAEGNSVLEITVPLRLEAA
jgi:signal transduction histidine kinase